MNDISVIEIYDKIDDLVADNFLVVSQDDNDEATEPKYSGIISEYDLVIENNESRLSVLMHPIVNSENFLKYIPN